MARPIRQAARALACRLPLAVLALAAPARALVVDPYFRGHSTITSTTQVFDYRANVPFPFFGSETRLDIDVNHGVVDDGGLSSSIPPGQWNFDMNVWAPLVGKYDLQTGGEVTYGSPTPGVFAVTWVDLPSVNDLTVRNTFQVVFVGSTGFHTNAGLAISPGSVIFAYGSPTDAHGTVHYSSVTGAAIGISTTDGFRSLDSLGVGDSLGVLSAADEPRLQASGDPFLFDPASPGTPIAFQSVPELGGNTGVGGGSGGAVALAAAPNPLRARTTLTYSLPAPGRVRLAIYDLGGRRVATLADGVEPAGTHVREWSARGAGGTRVAPGVYLARLDAAGVRRTRAVVVIGAAP